MKIRKSFICKKCFKTFYSKFWLFASNLILGNLSFSKMLRKQEDFENLYSSPDFLPSWIFEYEDIPEINCCSLSENIGLNTAKKVIFVFSKTVTPNRSLSQTYTCNSLKFVGIDISSIKSFLASIMVFNVLAKTKKKKKTSVLFFLLLFKGNYCNKESICGLNLKVHYINQKLMTFLMLFG